MGSFSQGKLYSCFVYSPVSRGEVKKPITWLTAGLSLTAGCQGFFPATIWGWAPASFIGSKRKIESKELPSCTIPLRLIAHTRQLEIFATAMWQQCKRLHKYKKPRWKETSTCRVMHEALLCCATAIYQGPVCVDRFHCMLLFPYYFCINVIC